jgi:hypothetical protein
MTLKSNAEELTVIAEEIGAQVIRGAVSYPGREGGFDMGDVDLETVLWDLKDQELVMIIAPLGPVEERAVICGLCGTPYEGKECPACKTERETAKRVIEDRLGQDREEKDRVIRDVEAWLEEQE